MVIVFRHIAFTRLLLYEHSSKIDMFYQWPLREIYLCYFAHVLGVHQTEYIFFEIIYNNDWNFRRGMITNVVLSCQKERTTDVLSCMCVPTCLTYLAHFFWKFSLPIFTVYVIRTTVIKIDLRSRFFPVPNKEKCVRHVISAPPEVKHFKLIGLTTSYLFVRIFTTVFKTRAIIVRRQVQILLKKSSSPIPKRNFSVFDFFPIS